MSSVVNRLESREVLRTWLLMTLTVAAMAGGAVMLAAFTSQTLGITARVEQPPTMIIYPLSPPPLTQDEVDAMTQAAIGATGCQAGDLEFPYEASTATCVWWALRISVRNNYYDPLVDLSVKDAFVGELDEVPLLEVPVKVSLLEVSQGQAEQTDFTDHVQIDWCVTGPLQDSACVPGGQLNPGLEAHLDLLLFAHPNAQGQQEFAAPGTYTLDEGPSAEWVDPTGVLCAPLAECPVAPPITVQAVSNPDLPAEPAETPTPNPTPTPTPTSLPEPAPTSTPTATATPTATPTPTPTPIP